MIVFWYLWAACVRPNTTMPPTPGGDVAPERATGCRDDVAAVSGPADGGMVASAHPEASRIGAEILAAGGSAADAATAMAVVLTLVEPQSSGIGGGAFLLYYDAETRAVEAWDGRETAPRATDADLFLTPNASGAGGTPRPWPTVVPGGLSVGTPGLVRLLSDLHAAHGTLPWADLWLPTATLAEQGFLVTPRMSQSIAMISATDLDTLRHHGPAADYFLPGGAPLAAGTRLQNPALAETTRAIAAEGADAFYTGPLAEAMVAAVAQAQPNPGHLTLADLATYAAVQREPLCRPYRGGHRICGHPPPTSGGVTVLQILGILEQFPPEAPDSEVDLHRFVEASRLALADRSRYLGDPAAVAMPLESLLAPDYLRARADLIGETRLESVLAGDLLLPSAAGEGGGGSGADICPEGEDTTHLVAIDAEGNVVTMTSSIENAFGAGLFVGGFLLNNQLTDFEFAPASHPNAPGACRRPRSSMAPILVLDDAAGTVELALGSPGGGRILSYVARVLHQVLDQGLDVQEAIRRPNVVARPRVVEMEAGCGTPAWTDAQRRALEQRGHTVEAVELNSGIQGIQRVEGGWLGGVDPRREGLVLVVAGSGG